MRPVVLLCMLLAGFSMKAQTLREILDAPFASDLAVSGDGKMIAWVENIAGERNIFLGSGNDFSAVRQLTNYHGDQGVSIGNLMFSADGSNLIFVRGNTKNSKGEPANPALLQENIEQTIYMQRINGDTLIKISAGTSPKLSNDGSKLGFIKDGQVWVADLLGNNSQPKELFRVRGRQSEIKWNPDDSQIAFTSSRGNHAYIGLYDFKEHSIKFLDPSVDFDFSPEWSPNGESIAFIRQPNAKDVAPFTPQKVGHPWSIRLYDLQSEQTKTIWIADEGMG